MVAQIRRLLDGEQVGDAGGVGPDVSHNPPPLLIGGTADAAFRRAAQYAEVVVAATAKGEEQIREPIRQFEDAGADELILFPASPDPDQVDRLASVAR